MMHRRMFKATCQQGRSERRGESYFLAYVETSERCENDAGGSFSTSC